MAYQELGKGYYSGRVWANCVVICLSSFYWGYYLGVLSTPIDNISYTLGWGSNKGIFTAVFSALYPLGAAFGAVGGGTMAKTKGRRRMLIIAAFFGMVSTIVHSIPFTATFAIGRFCVGVAGGVMAAVPSLYIAEISPPDISGKTGTVVQFNVTFSIFVSTALGLPLPTKGDDSGMNNWWIFMIAFPIIVVIVQVILFFCYFKHEPASWLISQGRTEEASESAKFYYPDEQAHAYIVKLTREMERNDVQLESIHGSIKGQKEEEQVTFKELLSFKGKYKKMMTLGVTLMVLQQWVGINAIINYGTFIFNQSFDVFISRLFASILMLINMIASLAGTPFVDKAGRRPLMIIGCAGMMSAHVVLALMDIFKAPAVLPLILITVFIIFFEISAGPLIWLYCGEIMNDKSMAVAVGINWVCGAIVELTFPFLIVPGMFIAFFLYGGFCFGGLVFCLLVMKETKGMTKEEINKQILGFT